MGIYSGSKHFSYDPNREYDEFGNWKRDYMNMSIPFQELAIPRNDEECELYEKRYNMKNEYLEKAVAEIAYKDRPDAESILEAFQDKYYESEDEFLNEQAELSKKSDMEY